ncbi:hypothetical protein ACOMHN_009089 [Nucella lapillus]
MATGVQVCRCWAVDCSHNIDTAREPRIAHRAETGIGSARAPVSRTQSRDRNRQCTCPCVSHTEQRLGSAVHVPLCLAHRAETGIGNARAPVSRTQSRGRERQCTCPCVSHTEQRQGSAMHVALCLAHRAEAGSGNARGPVSRTQNRGRIERQCTAHCAPCGRHVGYITRKTAVSAYRINRLHTVN